MHAELELPLALIAGFLLVLARVAGALVFVPVPGFSRGFQMARVVLALAITMLLYPEWPLPGALPSPVQMAGWIIADAALGILAGLMVAFVAEAFQIAAQAVGLEAGFAYASMVNPQTEADSGVLLVFAQLAAGLLLLALGLDREVLRAFAASLETFPPGKLVQTGPAFELVVRLGAGMFSTGMRLALPVLALLALMDLALALVGRLNQQLQLLTLAFPLKMLAAVLMLAWLAPLWIRLLGAYGRQAAAGLGTLFGAR